MGSARWGSREIIRGWGVDGLPALYDVWFPPIPVCQRDRSHLYKMRGTMELRLFLEPEERNDLLWSSVERFDFTPLEEKASDLRSVLLDKGWTELAG